MGKGEIISGGDGGLYKVRIKYNRIWLNAKLAQLEGQITSLEERLADVADEIASTTDKSKLAELTMRQEAMALQLAAVKKAKEYYRDVPADPQIEAWCADWTQDLSGEVGTIEIGGQYSPSKVLVRPGYNGRAVWSKARDGQLMHIKCMGDAAAFYNLAMAPGWQKWMPTYRVGTILAKEGDTCSVRLDMVLSAYHRDASLDVTGAQAVLSGVAIEYMSCNGAAFEVGDRVVVEYRNRSATGEETPVVIGFESHPKPCGFVFHLTLDLEGPLLPEHDPEFYVQDKDWNLVDTTAQYDPIRDVWVVSAVSPDQLNDPDGYWVFFDCDNGVRSQYPYRYRWEEQGQDSDRIRPGEYTDSIPFFRATASSDLPVFEDVSSEAANEWNAAGYGDYAVTCSGGPTQYWDPELWIRDQLVDGRHVRYGYGNYYTTKMVFTFSLTVKTSIPYELYEKTDFREPVYFAMYSDTIPTFSDDCIVAGYIEGTAYIPNAAEDPNDEYVISNFKVTGPNYTYDGTYQPPTQTTRTAYPAGETTHEIVLEITAEAGAKGQLTAHCTCSSGNATVGCTSEFYGLVRNGGFGDMTSMQARPLN